MYQDCVECIKVTVGYVKGRGVGVEKNMQVDKRSLQLQSLPDHLFTSTYCLLQKLANCVILAIAVLFSPSTASMTACVYIKLCIYVQNKIYFSHICLVDWCVSQQGLTDTFNTGDWDTVCLFLTSDNLRTTRTRDAVSICYDPRQPFLGRKK